MCGSQNCCIGKNELICFVSISAKPILDNYRIRGACDSDHQIISFFRKYEILYRYPCAELHNVCRRCIIIRITGDCIRTVAAIKNGRVTARATLKIIVTGIAAYCIIACPALNPIMTRCTIYRVISSTGTNTVITRITEDLIVAGTGIYFITQTSAAAINNIISIARADIIITCSTCNRVIAGTGINFTTSGTAANNIVAITRVNIFIASEAANRVIACTGIYFIT